jgi:hypothetical protein
VLTEQADDSDIPVLEIVPDSDAPGVVDNVQQTTDDIPDTNAGDAEE